MRVHLFRRHLICLRLERKRTRKKKEKRCENQRQIFLCMCLSPSFSSPHFSTLIGMRITDSHSSCTPKIIIITLHIVSLPFLLLCPLSSLSFTHTATHIHSAFGNRNCDLLTVPAWSVDGSQYSDVVAHILNPADRHMNH